MSSSSDAGLAEKVEAVLKARAANQDKPTDNDLLPVYRYLTTSSTVAASSSSSSSTSAEKKDLHWYCSKAESSLLTEAATYLIFLFAFQRQGTSKAWVDQLEEVLLGCAGCARAFGAARRKLGSRYLSAWPSSVRENFFRAVDKWQSELVCAQAEKARSTAYGSSATRPALYDLTRPVLQLLLGEPSLLAFPAVSAILDEAVASPTSPPSSLSAFGITTTHVRLLRTPDEARGQWSLSQLPAMGRRPIPFSDWCTLGIGVEVQDLHNASGAIGGKSQWEAVEKIIKNGILETETLQKGLLDGLLEVDPKGKHGRGLMSALSGLIVSDVPYFPSILSAFTTLLSTSPNRHIWSFDTSPELPHTLFSQLRSNSEFQNLLHDCYKSQHDVIDFTEDDEIIHLDKGKMRAEAGKGPLDWIGDFLLSLIDVETHATLGSEGKEAKTGSGFGEALAAATNFTFQEMQHSRLPGSLRAAAAVAGFEALQTAHQALSQDSSPLRHTLDATLDLHSTFITTVAFRPQNYPLPTWSGARASSRELLIGSFHDDAEVIIRSTLELANVSHSERKRLLRKKRGKGEVSPATPIQHLSRASVKVSLWTKAYEALSPSDPAGAAILLRSIAPFAHIELLDRQRSWSHEGLEEVVTKEEWVNAVRSVNTAIRSARQSFARSVESTAMQADPDVVKTLWKQPGVSKAITTLLLSPDEDVHTPIITLIQQSFDDVDDRGDCFRALLKHFPDVAMDGLTDFLRTFIQTASVTPESCSLAKWLVRCFHDVLEALCRNSGSSEALLQDSNFLTSYADGRGMAKRIEELWHLMTTSLALIFKRTLDWAPHFENEVMVDWMRDALIFGRQMTEHIRAFEGATLGQYGARPDDKTLESPIKVTSTGKKMTRQLEMVLTDLILWLRLTDVETLFQTHQLIKTILTRISRSSTDLSRNPALEKTLQEIDKFCRKATRSYTSRLTDDLLSELSELLVPFNLVDLSDDVQFVKQVSGTTPIPEPAPFVKPKPAVRNAFEEMMKASGKPVVKSKEKEQVKIPTPKSSDVDDLDDDFLDHLSANDLDIIEKRARIDAKVPKSAGPIRPTIPSKLQISARPQAPSNKLHVNLVPQPPPKPPTATTFKSKFMRELRQEHQRDRHVATQDRKRTELGGVVQKLPAASALGSGLGAYTGSRARTVQPVDSGSSASDSSDEENQAVTGLLAKQKPLPKVIKPVERRSIKVIGNDTAEIMRRNEERRANAHATKMRLKPDLNPLYRYVLSWNPDHTGPMAPHGQKYAADLSNMRNVPTTFQSSKQYEQVMLPLYLQELWSQCVKETSATSGPFVPVEVSSRQYEDDFVEIDLSVTGPMDFFVNDTDVITLRQPGNPNALFAKVQAFRRKPKDIAIKVRVLSSMDQRELTGKSKWQLRKHLSLSTAIREFAALKGLPYYEASLLQDILAGRSAVMPRLALDDIEDAIKTYDVNEPQAKAILGSMHVKGFALIQGPPGTGKTKTISGLVGKWMSERRTSMSVDGRPPPKPKLLVCAPSNAAIDEVCKRLILGVPGAGGVRLNPTVVRIGIDSSVNIAVKDVSLDSLVEARVNAETNGKEGGNDYARIQAELDTVKQQIKDKQEQLRLVQGYDEKRKIVENEYHALVTKRTQLGQASSRAKDAARDATRHLDGARRAAKEIILNEADIICATLSGAGQDTLAAHTFETVIIDEAAQAIEMSCLIPLKYGCKRCIMVGDPNQLPPTTFSVEADKYHYNESLFVRMTKHNSSHVSLLSIQYRMHPFISELPSKVFYNGELKDGPDMARKTAALWHQRNVFGPYRFFNVEGTEMKAGTSTRNPDEALAAVDLYRRLYADFGTRINLDMRIGVISMYKEQLWELKRKFTEAFGQAILETIDFNTVDGFQGQEKDIIILSCVRSGPNLRSIGFLKDARRMNVALTRAKSSLFVFGNGPTLERSDERWKIIVGDARDRGFFINYNTSTFVPGALEPPVIKKKKDKKSFDGASKTVSNASVAPDFSLPPKALAIDMSETGSSKRKQSLDSVQPEKKPRLSESSASSRQEAASTSHSPAPTGPQQNRPVPVSASAAKAVKDTNRAVPGHRPPQAPPHRPEQNGLSARPVKAPPPSGPPPKPPPQRPPEDVLFIKKKKKPVKPSTNGGPAPNVRAAYDRPGGRP
ncbi:senataxin [Kwoniella heveanensis CBS 569]|nr:senataxin [Kwoniella heveanensis CBS 569]